MTERDPIDDLREFFALSRDADAARAPSFDRVRRGRAGSRLRRRWLMWVASGSVVAAAAVAVVIGTRGSDERTAAVEPVRLRSATDFLLEMAPATVSAAVPRIGDVNDWFTLNGLGKESRT